MRYMTSGGLRVDQARRLKELEQENGRLRKVVWDLSIDNAIPKEATRGNYGKATYGRHRRQ